MYITLVKCLNCQIRFLKFLFLHGLSRNNDVSAAVCMAVTALATNRQLPTACSCYGATQPLAIGAAAAAAAAAAVVLNEMTNDENCGRLNTQLQKTRQSISICDRLFKS